MPDDLDRLQGDWRQVRFAENGRIDPPDSHGAPGAVLTITGTRFHVTAPGGAVLVAGRFRIAAVTPGHIDWTDSIGEDAGQTFPAIYRLDAHSFEFAAADAGLPRPRDFLGGPGITLRGFVRA